MPYAQAAAVATPPVTFQVAPEWTPQPHPSSIRGVPAAPYAFAHGQPGAWKGLLGGAILRAGLIGAGFYAGGVREPTMLVAGSLASSATISGLLVLVHAIRAQKSR